MTSSGAFSAHQSTKSAHRMGGSFQLCTWWPCVLLASRAACRGGPTPGRGGRWRWGDPRAPLGLGTSPYSDTEHSSSGSTERKVFYFLAVFISHFCHKYLSNFLLRYQSWLFFEYLNQKKTWLIKLQYLTRKLRKYFKDIHIPYLKDCKPSFKRYWSTQTFYC